MRYKKPNTQQCVKQTAGVMVCEAAQVWQDIYRRARLREGCLLRGDLRRRGSREA